MNYPDEWKNYRTQPQIPHYEDTVKRTSFKTEMMDMV